MEDTIIIKTQFAYMLRLDVPPPSPTVESPDFEDLIRKWVSMYNCTFYLGMLEKGQKTGKLHYQLIVWFEQKLCPKTMTKLRNWWMGKTGTHNNSHAFTSARKVASLAAYSTKGQEELLTNLSFQQLLLIPKWQNKKALKLAKEDEFLESLENALLKYIDTDIDGDKYSQMVSPFEHFKQGTPDFHKFCEMLNECHIKIYDKPCCHRNKYFRLALKYDVITFHQFLVRIGVIDSL